MYFKGVYKDPIEFCKECKGVKKNVCIRQIMAFCLASALLATNAFADQDVKQKISEKPQTVEVNVKTALDDGILNFDEAYKMALENNSSIKNLEANVEVMQDTKSKLVQSVDYVSMPVRDAGREACLCI